MPTISMFFGILIRMYFYDDKQHHAPCIFMQSAKISKPFT